MNLHDRLALAATMDRLGGDDWIDVSEPRPYWEAGWDPDQDDCWEPPFDDGCLIRPSVYDQDERASA